MPVHAGPEFRALRLHRGVERTDAGIQFQAIGLWHSLLAAGKKIPISGGSDYHRDSLFLFPGGPTTCVFAMSASPADILFALRQGHAYITFAPNGPALEMTAGDAMLGDSVQFGKGEGDAHLGQRAAGRRCGAGGDGAGQHSAGQGSRARQLEWDVQHGCARLCAGGDTARLPARVAAAAGADRESDLF